MIILPNALKIFLIISILIFVVHVINNVKKNKLSVRNSIVWLLMSFAIIISAFHIKSLTVIANFLGIKTLSNSSVLPRQLGTSNFISGLYFRRFISSIISQW